MDRREFIRVMGAGTLVGLGSSMIPSRAAGRRPPNIVYILADDLGYGDVRCLNPESRIPTPNIDRLAKEGLVFTDAHSGSAVCTPTRYGILTGRYAWRSRLQRGVLYGYSRHLIDPGRLTVASLLKRRGYHTGCIGKWHLGWDWAVKKGDRDENSEKITNEDVDYASPIRNAPADLGFDYFFGIPASLDMVPYVYVRNRNVVAPPTESIARSEGYAFFRGGPIAPGFRHEEVLPVLTREAGDFIRSHREKRPGKPFFLYFPLTAPHTPIMPDKAFRGKSGIGPYGDFVMQCDGTVGRILETLDELGLEKDTLVIFTSDNGPSPAADFEHLESVGHDSNHVFRGFKADIYEGGHRIPFIARWPGTVPAGSTYGHPICLTDLMATAARISDSGLPDEAGEDSVDLLPVLGGRKKDAVREALVHHSINGSFSIRRGRWKLELCPGSGGWSPPTPLEAFSQGLPMVQLYDMEEDIGERRNVQERYPEIVHELIDLLEQYVEEGRSTPGRPQKNDTDPDIWKYLEKRNSGKRR